MSDLEEARTILQSMNITGQGTSVTEKQMAQVRVDSLNDSAGNLNLADGYECKICKNKGVIAELVSKQVGEATRYSMQVVVCRCKPIRDSIRRMKRSGLEALLKKYSMGNFSTEEPWQLAIKTKAERYVKNPKGIFYIGGQSGCGKTFICTAMARELLYRGLELRYEKWRSKSVYLKGLINNPEEYNTALMELKTVDVLYIDDFLKVPIGCESNKPTPADLSLALEIIDFRYDTRKPTILSSEWSTSDIISFDEALGGRIYEMAGEYVLNIKRDKTRNMRMKNIEEI